MIIIMMMIILVILIVILIYVSKGIGRQGTGSFCKEFPCFNTTPCRHMPLPVHL